MEEQDKSAMHSQRGALGCGAVVAILVFVLLLVLLGANAAVGYFYQHCEGAQDIFDCLFNRFEDTTPEGAVVATGVYSFKGYSVTVTANIPLEGGTVTGSVSGTCDGRLKGTFDGQNNGVFSGTLTGTCSPFFVNIPAGAQFSGTVNKDSKTAPISFTGRGAGITHQGSMSLTY